MIEYSRTVHTDTPYSPLAYNAARERPPVIESKMELARVHTEAMYSNIIFSLLSPYQKLPFCLR